MPNKSIDPQLLHAYQNTRYRVFLDNGHLDLFIDRPDPEIDSLLARYRVAIAAFITAWNPFSSQRCNEENSARQQELIDDIKQAGYEYLRGEGQAMNSDWPAEESLLIMGIDEPNAMKLARRFEQHAYVLIRRNAPPRLVQT